MTRRVLFFGGNGHAAARLAGARPPAARLGIVLDDAPYPGFDGRPRAASLDAFLDAVERWLPAAALVYATGVGGLLALCLRARGRLRGTPLLLQAPVLWGLERRVMPRLMRIAPARAVAGFAFARPAFQAWFVRRHFERPLSHAERRAFFDGYAACAALGDLFAWLGPPLLRRLEATLGPAAAGDVCVWWGGCDRVVSVDELRSTERALGVAWPVRRFPGWGHYPMIDAPEAWADALAAHLDGREPATPATPHRD